MTQEELLEAATSYQRCVPELEQPARKAKTNDGCFRQRKPNPAISPIARFPSSGWKAKRLVGIPEALVLYCARHRFSTDAMEGTGNVMAVMDAMGHQSVNTTRIYNHSNVTLIREAIERRNQQLSDTVQ